MEKQRVAATMKGYAEQAPITEVTGMGTAELSEFTGKGGFLGLGGEMHGYRASMSDGAHTIEVVVQCPERNWAEISPAFQRVIKSVSPAEGGIFSAASPSAGTSTAAPAPAVLPKAGYGGGDSPAPASQDSTTPTPSDTDTTQ